MSELSWKKLVMPTNDSTCHLWFYHCLWFTRIWVGLYSLNILILSLTCCFVGLSNSHTPVRPPSTSSTGSRGRWVIFFQYYVTKNFLIRKCSNESKLIFISPVSTVSSYAHFSSLCIPFYSLLLWIIWNKSQKLCRSACNYFKFCLEPGIKVPDLCTLKWALYTMISRCVSIEFVFCRCRGVSSRLFLFLSLFTLPFLYIHTKLKIRMRDLIKIQV